MALVVLLLSETSEMGARERNVEIIGISNSVGASNFHNKFYDAISLPRSNILWHHHEEHTGLAISTTYST